jgi:hypothetical protein
MLCDEYVLETVKAEGDGLNLTAERIGLGWPFDEKNEFCARSGFGLNPRAIMCFNPSRVEPFNLAPVLRMCLEPLVGCRISNFGTFEVDVLQWAAL